MSKKTEICFGNPLFNGTRWRLDAAMQHTLEQMVARGADEGTVALKIQIAMEKHTDKIGAVCEMVPRFECRVESSVPFKVSTKENINNDDAMIWDGDAWVLETDVEQTMLEDLRNGREA